MKTRVHALRWYELEPLAIHHMCFNKNSNQIAVARSDQSIEIWMFEHSTLYLDRAIPKSKDRSIESLVWCQNRLFSIGLNGFLVEYDLFNLQEKNSVPTSFGGCWCMVPNEEQTHLAVGTEDGFISLYEVESDSDVVYRSSFKKQEGRILCLCWHNSGKYIVTGSVNSLRFWDARKGKALQKINARSGNAEVIIQCVAITSDLQIISGDNSGRISFWDAMQGLLISSIQSHQAEILCIDLIEENEKQSFFASGVDPAVIMFQRITTQKTGWIKGITRRIHTHDVRSMLRVNQYLVTGGVDSYLTLSKFPPNVFVKFPPVLPTSYINVAASINCVLFQYSSRLEMWELGYTNQDSDENYESLSLSELPTKLLELSVKANEVVVCSAISNDGKWLAFSTNLSVKTFQINMKKKNDETKVSLKKLKNSEHFNSVIGMKFISDSSKLITLTHSGKLQIILADSDKTSNFQKFEDIESKGGCHLLAVNDDGEYAAVGNHDGYVIVYSLIKYEVTCTLPKFNSQPTALEFAPGSHFLMIATQNRNVFEYDVKKDKFSNSFEKLCLINEIDAQKQVPHPCIRGFTFQPDQPDSFFAYDVVNLFCVNRKELAWQANKSNKWSENNSQKGIQSCSTYKHLLHFIHLKDDYKVAMQVPAIEIQKKLPPQLTQKQYGT